MRAFFIVFIIALLLIFVCIWLQEVKAVNEIDWDKLITAIIKIESNGNPNALGKAGERGLMQISEIVFREYINEQCVLANEELYYVDFTYYSDEGYLYVIQGKVIELYNSELNKHIGTWYLHRLKEHYIPKDKFSLEVLLASYNCGPTRMRRLNWDWTKAPKSTIRYVRKILKLYEKTN